MSTTIDSLEIKIESNSSAAAVGILDLADALGELKKNGTINVAVKNLNNLAEALKKINQVNSNVTKLSTLAKSVKDLSQAGSLNKLINQLNKVPGAINAISNMNTTGIEAKFQSIATAASHMTTVGSFTTTVTQMGKIPAAVQGIVGLNLDGFEAKMTQIANGMKKVSGIDAGGLPKMVNALAKIADVTTKLDDQTISDFAAKVDRLVQKLQPLSTQMTTVAQGFKAVNTNAKKAAAGFTKVSGKVNATTLNLTTLMQTVRGVATALMPLVNLLSDSISSAIEWDGVAARFVRGFGEYGKDAYSWIQRLNQELGINTQQFMQYSSVFATMLQGFGVSLEDSAKMAMGYTELTYDIWAGYNDIYKSFGDAADAVKSAIAGEVEPIRRAGFTIVDSQLAVTASNYGIAYSTQTATEAQKSYLRYLTLVDQAHAQNLVGTYARELNTAEGVMRTFSQQLKSLAQAFGSLFLPILVKIMPYLQVFVEILTDAIQAVAAFFGITIQGIDWGGYGEQIGDGVGDGLGDIEDGAEGATGAIKELKNAMLGIDELNVISPPDPSSGSGGGSGGSGDGEGSWDDIDIDSLWDESIFAGIQDQVKAIKEKFEEWLPVIGVIGAALAGLSMASLLANIGDALSQMSLLEKLFATLAIVTIEAALVFTFADNYLESGNFLYLIGEALVTAAAGYLLFKTWGVGGAVLGLSVSILAQIAAIELSLADGTVDLSSPELWTQALVTVLTGALGGAIIAKKTAFLAKEGLVIGLATTLSLTMMAINCGAIENGEIDTNSFESWVMQAISVAGAGMAGLTVGKALNGAAGGKTGLMIGVTVGLILNLSSVIGAKGEDFGNNISDWINGVITTVSAGLTAKRLWDLYGGSITTALSGLWTKISPLMAAGGTGGIVAWGGGAVAGLGTAIWGLYDAISGELDWLNGSLIAGGTTLAGAGVGAIIGSLGGPIGTGIGALAGLIIGLVTDLVIFVVQKWDTITEAIDTFFTETLPGFWDDVVTWITEDVPQFFRDLGNNVSYGIGLVVGYVVNGFLERWKDIKKFFTETVPKFFTETIPEWGKKIWNAITDCWNEDIKPFFTETIPNFFTEDLPEFFKSLPEKFKEIGEDIINGIWGGITGAWDWLKTTVKGWVDEFVRGFKDALGIHSPSTVFAEIGENLIEGIWEGIDGLWDWIKEKFQTWTNNITSVIKGGFDTDVLKDKISTSWDSAKTWWNEKKPLSEYTPPIGSLTKKVKTSWSDAKDWYNEKKGTLKTYTPEIGSISKNVSAAWSTAKTWWNQSKGKLSTYTPDIGNLKGKLSTAWSTAKSWWSKSKGTLSYTPTIGNIKSKLSSAWSTARSWWSRSKGALSYTPTIGNIRDKLKSAWNTAKSWWSKNVKLSIPSMSFKVSYSNSGLGAVKKAIIKALDLPGWPKLSFAANGGIFDAGSLIWAGERGAEVVANAAGGKTGVMNVNQMQDAVYEGVYAAVIAAMRASSRDGGQAVNVYLDGRQITSTVEQRQRERGATIMGNEVYRF